MHIELYQDRNWGWRWRAVDIDNRIVADSAESYVHRDNVELAVDNVVKGFRGHLEVICRERRGQVRPETETEHEEHVIAEYQHEGAK